MLGLILAVVKSVAECNRKSFDMNFGEFPVLQCVLCLVDLFFQRKGKGGRSFNLPNLEILLDFTFKRCFYPSQDTFHKERFCDSSTTELALESFNVKGKENIYVVVDP